MMIKGDHYRRKAAATLALKNLCSEALRDNKEINEKKVIDEVLQKFGIGARTVRDELRDGESHGVRVCWNVSHNLNLSLTEDAEDRK